MPDINAIHEEAMDLAEAALAAQKKNDPSAPELFRKAFDLEKQAAMAYVDLLNIEPTRSILFRSAANLAVQSSEIGEAEKLVYQALLGSPPSVIEKELRELLGQINVARILVTNPHVDVLQIRKNSRDVKDGSIALQDVKAMIQHGHNVWAAGANSVLGIRPAYYDAASGDVADFMGKVRVAPPRQGSFILTFYTHVPVRSDIQKLTGRDTKPFSREVTECIARSLGVINLIGEDSLRKRSPNLHAFRDAVKEGVSANLCEAVVGLQEAAGRGTVEFSFDWSKGQPAPQEIPSTVAIHPDLVSILRPAARYLRENVSGVESIHGPIMRMSRRRPEQKSSSATILARINGVFRPVHFRIEGENIAKLAEAYSNNGWVRVSGILRPGAKGWTLQEPVDLRVLEAREVDAGDQGALEVTPKLKALPGQELTLFDEEP